MKTKTLLYLIQSNRYTFLTGSSNTIDNTHVSGNHNKQIISVNQHTLESLLVFVVLGMCQYKKHSYIILESLLLTLFS